MAETEQDDKSWLRTPLTDSKDIAARYDEWVDTYDAELATWGYTAPERGAALLAHAVSSPASISVLDVGCGTGLTGQALSAHGFSTIDGVDLSPGSLDASRDRGVYRNLQVHDFNAEPLPALPTAHYGAAFCIGVLSYAHVPTDLIVDVLRVLEPGGVFVFTHRTDLWESQGLADALTGMVGNRNGGVATSVTWTEPEPYMPGNPDFADRVLIRYVTLTR